MNPHVCKGGHSNVNINFRRYSRVKDYSDETDNEQIKEAKEELFANRMAIARRIIALRETAGLKQKELALLMDVSNNKLSRNETGNTDYTLANIFELCQILGASADYILFGNEENVIDQEIAEISKTRILLRRNGLLSFLKHILRWNNLPELPLHSSREDCHVIIFRGLFKTIFLHLLKED